MENRLIVSSWTQNKQMQRSSFGQVCIGAFGKYDRQLSAV
jgi:hypothetical protein